VLKEVGRHLKEVVGNLGNGHSSSGGDVFTPGGQEFRLRREEKGPRYFVQRGIQSFPRDYWCVWEEQGSRSRLEGRQRIAPLLENFGQENDELSRVFRTDAVADVTKQALALFGGQGFEELETPKESEPHPRMGMERTLSS
jgi:hypothetical protein